jgi:hypothetical protein
MNSTQNSLRNLLSRLEKVRERAPGKYIARCPAHDDRTPSLSITERADGAVLLHCFAGCDPTAVCGAIGLDPADLFPPPDSHSHQATPQRMSTRQALEILRELESEIMVLWVGCCKVKHGQELAPIELERIGQAAALIVGYLNELKL